MGDADGAGANTVATSCPSGYKAKLGVASEACAAATCVTNDANATDTDTCCEAENTIASVDKECDDKIPAWASINGKRSLTTGEAQKVAKAKADNPGAKEVEILKSAGVGAPVISLNASTDMDKEAGLGPPLYVGSYKTGNCAGQAVVYVKSNYAPGSCTEAGTAGWHCWECVDGNVLFGVFAKDPLNGNGSKHKINWVDAKAQVKLDSTGDHCGSKCHTLNNESFRIAWHSSAKQDLCKHGQMKGAAAKDKKKKWPPWLIRVVAGAFTLFVLGVCVAVFSSGRKPPPPVPPVAEAPPTEAAGEKKE